jgi:hypothetical protein
LSSAPNLAQTARYRGSLTVDEANALLAVYRVGHTSEYAEWRSNHLGAEQSLKQSGLVVSDNGPHRAAPVMTCGTDSAVTRTVISADINLSPPLTTTTCR